AEGDCGCVDGGGRTFRGHIIMNEEYYKKLNAALGADFDRFALENSDWMAKNVPTGAIVVMQTDDPHFNGWARRIAEQNRDLDNPPRPLVLVYATKQSRMPFFTDP